MNPFAPQRPARTEFIVEAAPSQGERAGEMIDFLERVGCEYERLNR